MTDEDKFEVRAQRMLTRWAGQRMPVSRRQTAEGEVLRQAPPSVGALDAALQVYHEPAKALPVLTNCDVLVVGAGPAAATQGLAQAPEDYPQALWGNLLLFGAVLCEAAYVVIGKRLSATVSPKRIAALINLNGFALCTPAGLYLAWHFDFGAVQLQWWLLLVFYALAASVWVVWLWMTGLKTIPATQAGVFTVMLPVATAAIGILGFGEQFTQVQAVAFVLALISLLLATLPGRRVH